MSHVTEVKVKVKDLDALEEAAVACGLELKRDKTKFNWYGHFVGDTTPPAGRNPKDYGKCDHVLALPGGGYEIGVVKALDGDGYDLMFDSWGDGRRLVRATGGMNMPKLKAEYACAVTKRKVDATLARRGFKVTREDLPNHHIRLKLRRR